jgi:hypothetical protein
MARDFLGPFFCPKAPATGSQPRRGEPCCKQVSSLSSGAYWCSWKKVVCRSSSDYRKRTNFRHSHQISLPQQRPGYARSYWQCAALGLFLAGACVQSCSSSGLSPAVARAPQRSRLDGALPPGGWRCWRLGEKDYRAERLRDRPASGRTMELPSPTAVTFR